MKKPTAVLDITALRGASTTIKLIHETGDYLGNMTEVFTVISPGEWVDVTIRLRAKRIEPPTINGTATINGQRLLNS